MNSDKTINDIIEIFADSLQNIPSDENLDVYEDDSDFQSSGSNPRVMIHARKQKSLTN